MDLHFRTRIGALAIELPVALDLQFYRSAHPDLSTFDDATLEAHYRQYGEGEGRQANRLGTRLDFVNLIPAGAEALEIGPFYNPVLRGPDVQYFDVLSTSELVERARSLGVDTRNVPRIDFVSPIGDLSVIDRDFDFVLSSHCIEHQPDLVRHLQRVSALLRPGGMYFVLVPDKRYCFDHFLSESSLADILDAYHAGRQTHLLRSVIEHRVLTTHNDSLAHWLHQHGEPLADIRERIQAALGEYERAQGGYIDVHAWYFTPRSAAGIFSALQRADYTDLGLQVVYPTRYGSNEFWMVLRKPERS
ncbi:class I SAM-dependent methyltransferase [Roseomonas sp. FDAARGOS_362]|uniref:class I SAM-dependent methyltransferase n=1 Tax=Roseomonas sp. FDAARGOS_362 TaxID=2018065 RepID=UPI001D011213|nr:class I SAM-dependent methyltransferase [Roseomonas sp. FDAARGOS_362]